MIVGTTVKTSYLQQYYQDFKIQEFADFTKDLPSKRLVLLFDAKNPMFSTRFRFDFNYGYLSLTHKELDWLNGRM